VRRLDVGQVAYVYRGGVTFLQIKRLTGTQAAIGASSASFARAGLAGGAGRGAARANGAGAFTAGPAGDASGWPADVGQRGEPPTIPLPAIGAAPGAPGGSPPGSRPGIQAAGAFASGLSALPDVSEVLDEAFGARHD
jgi:hypothetical protein